MNRARMDFASPIPRGSRIGFEMKSGVFWRPGAASRFHAAGYVSFSDLFRAPAVVVDRNRFRDVGRLAPLTDGSVAFVKRFHPGRRPSAARRAAVEASRIQRFTSLGFPGPELAAWGWEGREAILLFIAPAGARPLPDYLRASSAEEVDVFLRHGADLLGRIHAAGVRLPDLAAHHVQVTREGRPYFIDLARARFHGRMRRSALHDLARLSATLEHEVLDEGRRRRFLRAYLRSAGYAAPGARMEPWFRRTMRLEARARRRGFFPRPFPIAETREGAAFAYWNTRYMADWRNAGFQGPGAFADPEPPAVLLRDLGVRRNFRVETPGGRYYLKVHREKAGAEKGGAGRREWRNHLRLLRAGVPVPEPACHGAGPGYSFFASRAAAGTPCDTLLQRFGRAEHRARALAAEDLARLVRRLHGFRLFHRDLYLCHVMEQGGRFLLIDLERLQEGAWNPGHRRIKDLAALLYASIEARITRTDRLRFFRTYRGGGRLGRGGKDLARAVQRKAEKIRARERRKARRSGEGSMNAPASGR